ncbi:hypothetical protein [Streptomyces parvulus]|uniref:hypothetical protein n=1 Tax=Streptomyces parvulus TaxID=146923 RepID=UPI003805AB25
MTDLTNELAGALRALAEHGEHLAAFAAAPEQLDEIGADLARAHRLLANVRAEQAPTGCRVHPAAPPDPASGAACLFCATNRRRGQTADATAEVSVSAICQAIVEEGHEAAVARFGARAVARAILTCRKDPEFLGESA